MKPTEILNHIPQAEIQAAIDKVGYDVDQNGCHLWRGAKATNGYGRVYIGRVRVQAQRAAWVAKNGPMELGDDACHRCDVRNCINPDHIFPGSRSENMRDAAAKRRLHAHVSPETMPRGEQHGSAKLSIRAAFEIWLSLESPIKLGRKYGVNQTTISRIKSGNLWRVPIQDYARQQFAAIRALAGKEAG